MSAPYKRFLKSKIQIHKSNGFEVDRASLPATLLDHAKDSVVWACGKGNAAVFSSFGMTKTRTCIQILLEVRKKLPNAPALVICPLGVKSQFQSEDGPVMGVEFQYIRNRVEQHDATSDFHITNYERIRDGQIDLSIYGAVALDEGSVLRNISSDTTQMLLHATKKIPYKFVFTATPSPNDYIELLYYAEYLGVMDRGQSKTRFFNRNSEKADELTLNPTCEEDFWLWVSSWSLWIDKPSDLGYSDEGYELPEVQIVWHEIKVDQAKYGVSKDRDGQTKVFADSARSLQDESKVKAATVDERLAKAVEIINQKPDVHWILWHLREDERRAIEKAIPDMVTVYGSQTIEEKEAAIIAFSRGEIQKIALKPEMFGCGCNFQHHCADAFYMSIDHRFHDFIQSVHRILRFMQKRKVTIHIGYTEEERLVAEDLKVKWNDHNTQRAKMTALVRTYGLSHHQSIHRITRSFGCQRKEYKGKEFTIVNNDSVLELADTPDNKFGLYCTSIPFSIQYEYAQSYNDFGHNLSNEDFWKQMDYIIPQMHRTLQPGRICAVHVKDRIVPGNFSGLGMATIYPFSDDTIRAFTKHGFAFMGRATIVTDVVRENNQSYRLGWSEVCKDGTKMGFGLPEYILIFRKLPTDLSDSYADIPVTKMKKDYTRARWQIDANSFWRSNGNRLLTPAEIANMDLKQAMNYFNNWTFHNVYDYEEHVAIAEALESKKKLPTSFASVAPQSWNSEVWTDITRMRTLNTILGQRQEQQHLCPLPFDIVGRVITRYSNPGEIVADPFAGIGTTPLMAIQLERQGWGCDLNPGYAKWGFDFCKAKEDANAIPNLFGAFNIDIQEPLNQTA